jgi:hypothetical protein
MHGREQRMVDHLDLFLIGWLFFLMIGSWVLVNALIDLGARRLGRWLAERWSAPSHIFDRLIGRERLDQPRSSGHP